MILKKGQQTLETDYDSAIKQTYHSRLLEWAEYAWVLQDNSTNGKQGNKMGTLNDQNINFFFLFLLAVIEMK